MTLQQPLKPAPGRVSLPSLPTAKVTPALPSWGTRLPLGPPTKSQLAGLAPSLLMTPPSGGSVVHAMWI
jgi:hypothetical protein